MLSETHLSIPGLGAGSKQLSAASFSARSGEFKVSIKNGEADVALVTGGSFGVRGCVAVFRVSDALSLSPVSEVAEFINAGCEWVKRSGIFRIHTLLERGDSYLHDAFRAAGFRSPLGERLFIADPGRWITGKGDPTTPQGIVIRAGGPEDVDAISEKFAQYPQLAFCPWERELLRDFSYTDRIFLVAEGQHGLVGAVVGGNIGPHATLSHLWADHPSTKGLHVGPSLVTHALHRFTHLGTSRVHLITNDEGAGNFWTKLGFEESHDLLFLERDLEP